MEKVDSDRGGFDSELKMKIGSRQWFLIGRCLDNQGWEVSTLWWLLLLLWASMNVCEGRKLAKGYRAVRRLSEVGDSRIDGDREIEI